jgi:hypothetical protein
VVAIHPAPALVNRLAALLAGLWAGVLLCIGGLAAPAAFAGAATEVAGRIAGRMFAIEAHLGIGVGVALVLLLRHRSRIKAGQGEGSLFSTELMLVLAALFCTVMGYFGLQPMMAAARAGQGSLSFGALHGLSAGFFGLKGLLVLGLAWRLTRR